MDRDTPIVAVAADLKLVGERRWQTVADHYIRALAEVAGVLPLIVPAIDGMNLDALVGRVDGVLLPGSRSNVEPTRYGEAMSEKAEPYDPARDAVVLPLIDTALKRGVPLFAICRGLQELNVAAGGSLVPEVHALPGRDDHRAPEHDDADVRFAIRQDVSVQPGGLLEKIVGAGTLRVNSLHWQGIGRLGGNLVVEALAPDGTIEGVSVKNASNFALGVQWHPEYWATTDAPSRALFEAFGDAVRAHRARAAATAAR